jgi:16S rRNA (uracil1498-N3)-methyltransferase
MSNLRFYSPNPIIIGKIITLSESAATHATKVMRLKVGDSLTLFCGDGFDYTCALLSLEKKSVTASVISSKAVTNESPLSITLLQGISSGDRMDYTVQKAVEMGVKCIQPIFTERTLVKLTGDRVEKRVLHWQQVAIAACEQSGRAYVPQIKTPKTLSHWLSDHPLSNQCRLLLNPIGASNLTNIIKPSGDITLLIGAEGGLSHHEITTATSQGFQSILLGPRILRTETAALAAIASMHTLWGDF